MQNEKKSIWFYIRHLPDYAAGSCLAVIIILEGLQAVMRYLFRHPLLFVDDVVVCCFAWTIFIGSAVAYREGMHFGLEFLDKLFSGKGLNIYKLGVKILSFFCFVFLFRLSILLYQKVGTKILFTTKISYKWIDIAIVIGFALMIIYSAEAIWKDLRSMRQPSSRNMDGGECNVG